jgi:hypothetical protein
MVRCLTVDHPYHQVSSSHVKKKSLIQPVDLYFYLTEAYPNPQHLKA